MDAIRIGNTGASITMDGAEFIIYNRTLSQAERDQVEAYLGTKWGITVT
jgi:hypothetical protein